MSQRQDRRGGDKADGPESAPDEQQPQSDQPSKPSVSTVRKFFSSNWFRLGLAVVMLAIVGVIVSREINLKDVESAFKNANLWWVLAAAIAAGMTWVGSAMPLQAYSSTKVSFTDALLVQGAASFVSVVAPSGTGPIAIHLRYLTKRGVKAATATAVVVLIELSQVAVSMSMLLVSVLIDHRFPKLHLPLHTILIVVGVVVLLALVLLLVPRVRKYLTEQLLTYWDRARAQFNWVRERPRRVVYGLSGVFIQSAAAALALLFSLYAVGHSVSIAMAITIYLVGSTLGSMIPTPGGIGSTTAALVAALHLAGIPAAGGLSAVVLFRVVDFYLQIPLGWVCFEAMQKRHLL